MASIYDQMASKLAPTYRMLYDKGIDLYGTQTQLLRISHDSDPFTGRDFDVLGEETEPTIDSTVIENVVITYPFSEVQIFSSRNNEQSDVNSIDLMEVLPTILIVPFEGEYDEKPIAIQKDDIVVDCLFDHHNNKLPMILRVKRQRGKFMSKHLIGREYEVVLNQGQLEDGIQQVIDEYINGL